MKDTKLESKTSTNDVFLWLAIGVSLMLAIGINYHFSHQLLAIRLIAWIIGILILASLFFYTTQGRRLWSFSQAARAELYKVVWPTRQETVRTTLLVMVMVLLAGLFLWAVDSFLLWLVAFLTG
ncbi:MAG TPA: preprotein translocase subunit SecE [Gammaproteobacteria bacterium]|nr:preprotein translocase subunit SecE [Gammaproteobacteria bacterium]